MERSYLLQCVTATPIRCPIDERTSERQAREGWREIDGRGRYGQRESSGCDAEKGTRGAQLQNTMSIGSQRCNEARAQTGPGRTKNAQNLSRFRGPAVLMVDGAWCRPAALYVDWKRVSIDELRS
jgi:hypothetical protein